MAKLTARQVLEDLLVGELGASFHRIETLLDAYRDEILHEGAETIRRRFLGFYNPIGSVGSAADFIDPQADNWHKQYYMRMGYHSEG